MTSRQQRANAIRALSMDAVQKAKSGHPGAPMGMADIAEVLWTDFLKHNPGHPEWVDRDRFVLSNGHGSMLLYSLLHLTGYDLPMEEIEQFRQLGSKTPGHPEYGETVGVETTTGPLGQGLANAVGMAIAEKVLAARFNREESCSIVNHHTWVFVGDGCLMEGVSHEAASLAGTLRLGKLICVYDDNGISIDGEVKNWFTDDTPRRFEAYGWHVIPDVNGHDAQAVTRAMREARDNTDQPTIICCKTRIGLGAPTKAGTAASHGAPLGEDEVSGAREALDWHYDPFCVPDEIYEGWDCRRKGAEYEDTWKQKFAAYQQKYPELATEFERRMSGELPEGWAETMESLLQEANIQGESMASRQASGKVIGAIAAQLPELLGGSADLSGSNCTIWPEAKAVTGDDADGNYIYYGVREFGMTAITTGMALHGGLRPYGGTFLTFMEYARNAVRMSALMGVGNIFVYTHDSIGQGEDGPTHQPVEQLANLRGTPNMSVWRPCDTVETVAAWQAAIERKSGPVALVFSRQSLPWQAREADQIKAIRRGGYILREPEGDPEALIIATGSEVDLAVKAFDILTAEGLFVRVVSMPSVDVFESQSDDYKESVLPNRIRRRLAVESAHPDYWRKWVGLDGGVVGLDRFGVSAPGGDAFKYLGFTPEHVVDGIKRLF
ncbi:MAG: transketolase [Pseudomonadales bacterium]